MEEGRFDSLGPAECRQLLAEKSVGRVGWISERGLEILPVTYGVVDDAIVFRTAAHSVLADLGRPTEVAFEIDDVDTETSTGWSVLVRGRSEGAKGGSPTGIPDPWAPGERRLTIRITPTSYTGRAVSAG